MVSGQGSPSPLTANGDFDGQFPLLLATFPEELDDEWIPAFSGTSLYAANDR